MTSKLTRERIELIANFHRVMALPTSHAEIEELARMALAAMEGESHTDDELSNLLWYSQEATCHSDPNYSCEFQRLATPGLVAGIILELQERRKAAMDGEPVAEVLSNRPGNDTSTIDRALPVGTQLYRHAQPALVVPDEIKHRIGGLDWGWEGEFNRGWNACRAAMLQAQPQNAQQNIPEIIPGGLVEAVNNLLNNDGSRGCYDAMECNAARVKIELWLAQRQRWEGQRKTNLSAGNSSVIPESWQVEAEKLAEMHGMSFVLFRHGEAPQCADPTKVVISFTDKGLGHDTLPAAHQEVKGE